MKNEIWKPINYETFGEYYEISTNGEIKSRNTGNKLTSYVKNGYMNISLHTPYNKSMRIHRIIALTFIENDDPNIKNVVNHIDGNKLNNSITNLEWTTSQKNTKDAYDNGLIVIKSHAIVQFDKQGNKICEFDSVHEAERKTGIIESGIRQVLKQTRKSAGGFVWKYTNDIAEKEIVIDEERKNITGFSNYDITKSGRVISKRFNAYISTYKNDSGYEVASLKQKGKNMKKYVHRIVAQEFVVNPDPEIKNIVNHKDGDVTNNTVDNLEWVTNSENILHAIYVLGHKTNKKKENIIIT